MIYRATETALFTKCPMAWHLRKQGWVSNLIGMKEVAAVLGTSFHTAAEHLVFEPEDLDGAQERAKASLIKEAGKIYNSGRPIAPKVEAELDALPIRSKNAVKGLHDNLNLLLDHYEIVDSELKLREAGNTTLDLLVREYRTGLLGILDWKCKTFNQPWYKTQFISDFAESWQLKHYCWGYEHEFGEPVDFFLLGLMDVTTKAKLELHPYHINDVSMGNWLASAEQCWDDMHLIQIGERVPSQSSNCRDQYGRCEYYDACFLHQYRDTMTAHYTKEEGL